MTRKFSVLYITGNIEEKQGGPGTTTRLLCEALARRGHIVELLTLDVDEDYLKQLKTKVPIFNVKTFLGKNYMGRFRISVPELYFGEI